MTIKEVAVFLDRDLRENDTNFHCVGIQKDTEIIIYTYNEPTPQELALVSCGGFLVTWKKGEFILG